MHAHGPGHEADTTLVLKGLARTCPRYGLSAHGAATPRGMKEQKVHAAILLTSVQINFLLCIIMRGTRCAENNCKKRWCALVPSKYLNPRGILLSMNAANFIRSVPQRQNDDTNDTTQTRGCSLAIHDAASY